MREVERSRFVAAPPTEVERVLVPAAPIEYEGSFTVKDVRETTDGWIVTTGARGLEFAVEVRPFENGLSYVQGENGPLKTLETTITYRPENEGTRVRMRSRVSTGVPPSAVTDRIAAWKRRGELRRALDRLADDVG